ncbi:hypothetical protein OF83DRAFT_511576 [Amylostereum chailletii]|nr:hypothetical protein OF83DRAFT_511576 [Amylostereum chailletii]
MRSRPSGWSGAFLVVANAISDWNDPQEASYQIHQIRRLRCSHTSSSTDCTAMELGGYAVCINSPLFIYKEDHSELRLWVLFRAQGGGRRTDSEHGGRRVSTNSVFPTLFSIFLLICGRLYRHVRAMRLYSLPALLQGFCPRSTCSYTPPQGTSRSSISCITFDLESRPLEAPVKHNEGPACAHVLIQAVRIIVGSVEVYLSFPLTHMYIAHAPF